MVVEADEASKRYGDHLVLDKISIKIERGEKVAFVGRNGEGKTTLSRMILGQIDFEGVIKRGHKVSIGYFAQNQDELLNDEMTVLETVERTATGDVRTRLRDILGAFLFHGEDVDKKVKVLSGGERSRLATIQLLLEPYNLLLLDEPTNHLDIRSKEILKKALKKFDGTLIVVSHDRDFLDGLVDKVYEFRDKKIKTYLGGIAEFLRSRKIESLRELEKKESPAVKASGEAVGSASQPESRSVAGRPAPGGAASSGSTASGSTSARSALSGSASAGSTSARSALSGSASAGSTSSGSNPSEAASAGSATASAAAVTGAPEKVIQPLNSKERYLEKKETERVYRRLRRQAEESEAEITVLEKEIAEMNAKLASGDSAVVSDPAFYTSYEEKKKALDTLMQRWETAHNELEVFMADYMNGDANL